MLVRSILFQFFHIHGISCLTDCATWTFLRAAWRVQTISMYSPVLMQGQTSLLPTRLGEEECGTWTDILLCIGWNLLSHPSAKDSVELLFLQHIPNVLNVVWWEWDKVRIAPHESTRLSRSNANTVGDRKRGRRSMKEHPWTWEMASNTNRRDFRG